MVPPRHDLIVAGELFQRSKNLAEYIINKEMGLSQRHDRVGEKLYELCNKMRHSHDTFFDGIVNRLNLNGDNIYEVTEIVMEELLAEQCNFGRVVSLYTFCLTVCVFCNDNNLPEMVDIVTTNTAQALCNHLDWFEKEDSWNGFLNYFTTPEEKLWKGMIITTVGLGAVAGLLYAHS